MTLCIRNKGSVKVKYTKLVKKYFLDLRKKFLNQENIEKFFSKQEDLSAKENFLVPKVYLN